MEETMSVKVDPERDAQDEAAKEAKRRHLWGRYNNHGLETGCRLQGEHFLHRVEELDELDPEWTEAWLTWIYDHMYNRTVLDQKTRILIVLGECCVLGAEMQIANHMRSAMRAGATKEEVLEVVLQSAIYGGMPRCMVAMKHYRALMKDIGLLDLSEPVFRGDARE
jgi:alkylhydroperoxidase/carboxymuconolactone decarboxylase family protein YurZ